MTSLPEQTNSGPIDGRAWLAKAIADRTFAIQITGYPPPAELDGESIDFRALVHVASLWTAAEPYEVPVDLRNDYNRALKVAIKLGLAQALAACE